MTQQDTHTEVHKNDVLRQFLAREEKVQVKRMENEYFRQIHDKPISKWQLTEIFLFSYLSVFSNLFL